MCTQACSDRYEEEASQFLGRLMASFDLKDSVEDSFAAEDIKNSAEDSFSIEDLNGIVYIYFCLNIS